MPKELLERCQGLAPQGGGGATPEAWVAVDSYLLTVEELEAVCQESGGIPALRDLHLMADAALTTRLEGEHELCVDLVSLGEAVLSLLLLESPDGIIYTYEEGVLLPHLVTGLRVSQQREEDLPLLLLEYSAKRGSESSSRPLKEVRGTVGCSEASLPLTAEEFLAREGLIVPGVELLLHHEREQKRLLEVLGTGYRTHYVFRPGDEEGEHFVHDLAPEDLTVPLSEQRGTPVPLPPLERRQATRPLPLHPFVRGCPLLPEGSYLERIGTPTAREADLPTTYERIHHWYPLRAVEEYRYNDALRNRLVLPSSQRRLLDALTNEHPFFKSDFIPGKGKGSLILCKGQPGLGKTLTAEVYAETNHRPLLRLQAGALGTTAATVSTRLRAALALASRLHLVLLLDEADVYVARRGTALERNAVVTEFLRALEYFPGLLFLTTNKPDDIDEAVLQRCTAIISYEPLAEQEMLQVWQVMNSTMDAGLSDHLLGRLAHRFAQASPREVKHLLALTLRMHQATQEPLSLPLFEECAAFCGLT